MNRATLATNAGKYLRIKVIWSVISSMFVQTAVVVHGSVRFVEKPFNIPAIFVDTFEAIQVVFSFSDIFHC